MTDERARTVTAQATSLSNKDQRFADEYLVDLDPYRAAIEAGYSETMARTKAYCWVSNSKSNTKPHVFAYIQQKIAERSKRTEIDQDRVLQEYARLAFLDARKFFDENGNLRNIHELDDDTAAALSGLEITTEKDKNGKELSYTKKIKLSDKRGALDSVARHLGMFEKDNAQKAVNITIQRGLTGDSG